VIGVKSGAISKKS